MDSKDLWSRRWATFFAAPGTRLSTQRTCQPSASSRSQRWEPRKPAPPVTTARRVTWPLAAADPAIDEAVLAHHDRIVDVPPVHDHRAPHHALEAVQAKPAEFVPFGDEQVCI